MAVRQGFKQTEVGILPNDWDLVSLGQIGETIIGLTYTPEDVSTDGILVLRSSNIMDGRLRFEDNVYVSCAIPTRLMVIEGDILICVRNGSRELIGKAALIDDSLNNMTFGAFMSVFRTRFSKYVFYQFQSDLIARQIKANIGATINQITNANLNSFLIPLPPLPEQNRIAEVLSDIDAQIAALDALIAKKRDIKQGVMQELLTGRRRLPGFSGEWTTTSLGKTGDWYGGGTPSMSNMEFWTGGTIPWASSNDVRTGILTSTSSTITQAAVLESSTKLLPSGAILLVTRSGILRKYLPVALCGIPIAINQDIKAIVPYPVVTSGFLYHALVGHSEAILATCMKSGTTVESIDFNWLKAFHVPLPVEIEEQETIANVLTDMDSEIKLLQAQRNKVSDLKQAMMQELLTGRTRLI